LSLLDLIRDDTLNLDMGAFFLHKTLTNSSFLTAANPSGTGKTTLMGALLGLLKPEVRIETIENSVEEVEEGKKGEPISNREIRYLIHEIGSGPYYSYIWGEQVGEFFGLAKNESIASCMHADTLEEMKDILFSPPLNVEEADFNEVDLILFMRKRGGLRDPLRRVSHVYERGKDRHRLIFRWREKGDCFERRNLPQILETEGKEGKRRLKVYRDFLEEELHAGVERIEELRGDLLEFLKR